ncbi:hypothetical protein COO72_02750 [Bifidobacterium callitrichos]|nr:hypothetical protein COO72_02750 [Bifidobacterium callitrichos]
MPKKRAMKLYVDDLDARAFKQACEARGVSMSKVLGWIIHRVAINVQKNDPKSLDQILKDLDKNSKKNSVLRNARDLSERLKRTATESPDALLPDALNAEQEYGHKLGHVDFLDM